MRAWKRSWIALNDKKIMSLIGISMKAGKVASGEFAVEKAVKTASASVVIVSTQASANTKKKFRNMCEYYKTPYYEFGDKTELGRAIGKEFRASLAVTDENLGKALEKQIQMSDTNLLHSTESN